MDERETHNRQHRATHINPDLRKAQSDIARGLFGLFQLTPGACIYFVHPHWDIHLLAF